MCESYTYNGGLSPEFSVLQKPPIFGMGQNLGTTTLPTCTFNPLGPSIHMQILLTDLQTFSYGISWEKLLKDESNFPLVIILLILI